MHAHARARMHAHLIYGRKQSVLYIIILSAGNIPREDFFKNHILVTIAKNIYPCRKAGVLRFLNHSLCLNEVAPAGGADLLYFGIVRGGV